MGKRTVLNAGVTEIEKRREPSKHYVYIIHVTWSDKSVNVIYRRYSAFFDFQVKLLASFPEEAGANNPSSRCIPFLPGKKLFGRSHIREVALKRLSPLDEYCQSLVKLPSKISDSSLVVEFFTPTPEDVSPPAPDGESRRGKDIDSISEPIQAEQYQVVSDYKKQQKNEVDLTAGDLVEVFEKNDNGWWFVTINDQHGWAPGTFLQKPDGSEEDDETVIPGNDETYITNNAYKAQADDEISFETGVLVNIEQKSLDGWWKVSYQGQQGWAPATYLQIYKGPSGVTAKPPTQSIGNVMLLKGDNSSRPLPKPGSTPFGSESGLGAGTRPPLPAHPLLNDEIDHDNIYTNYDTSTEAKPTPPRRATVRNSARRGATRNTKLKQKRIVEHYAIEDFKGAAGEGSLSFREGDRVELLEENDGGWWFVKINGKEGWAPSTYIEKRELASSAGGSANSKSPLASLDEETGESGPPALPARPAFGSGGNGAFKPVQKSNKATPPPVDRSSSPAFQRKSIPSDSVTDKSDGDLMAALRNRFEKTSAGEPSNSKPKPKPPKPVALQSQPYCNRDALYLTTASYQNDENDGLSFREGEHVEVIKKDGSGWWMVRIGTMEGWAPSTFLEKA